MGWLTSTEKPPNLGNPAMGFFFLLSLADRAHNEGIPQNKLTEFPMKRLWLRVCVSLLLVCAGGMGVAAASQPAPDNAQVVEQARRSYYSLRAIGLDEFQSTVKPNWEVVLRDELKSSPENAQAALKLLNGLHFSMLLDKNGKVTVTHHADIEPSNETQRKGFDQIYEGLDQAVSGFFATWSMFMLNSPSRGKARSTSWKTSAASTAFPTKKARPMWSR